MDNYLETISDVLTAPGELRVNCPLCGEEDHKLYVSEDEPFLWHCKKCDEAGNGIQLVMKTESCTWRQAVQICHDNGYYPEDSGQTNFNRTYGSGDLTLGEQLYLSVAQLGETTTEDNHNVSLTCPALPKDFKLLSESRDNPESYPFLAYLKNRGVTLDQIIDYKIGYSRNHTMISHKGNEIPLGDVIVFPTFNLKGELVYWNTRAIGNSFIKTINAPAGNTEYSKDRVIFNINRAVNRGVVVITESVFNALTIGDYGVATFGKQVTDHQLDIIRTCALADPRLKVYVFLDPDANKQAFELGKRLLDITPNVRVVVNPTTMDINEMGRKQAYQLLHDASPVDQKLYFKLFPVF